MLQLIWRTLAAIIFFFIYVAILLGVEWLFNIFFPAFQGDFKFFVVAGISCVIWLILAWLISLTPLEEFLDDLLYG